MKIEVVFNLHELVLAMFRGGDAEQAAYDEASAKHDKIYIDLFEKVINGQLDGFTVDQGDRFQIYHLSTKQPETMQVSYFWIKDGEPIPTMDIQIHAGDYKKLLREAAPDNVTIYTVELENTAQAA